MTLYNQKIPAVPRFSWWLPAIPLSIWGLVALFVSKHQSFYFLNAWAQNWPDSLWGFFVNLGNGWGIYGLAFPLLIFAPRIMMAAVLAGIPAGILSRSLKLFFEMPRPPAVLDNSSFFILEEAMHAHSFPSGHTLTAFAVATALYFAIPTPRRKPFLWLFVLAALAGMARMAVGVHWLDDVLMGTALGLFSGLLGVLMCRALPDGLFTPTSWLMRLIAIVGGFNIYLMATSKLDLVINAPLQILGIVITVITLIHFVAQNIYMYKK